jgi:hypothetical protein
MPLPVQHAVVPYVWCCVRADLHAGHGVLALGHSPSCTVRTLHKRYKLACTYIRGECRGCVPVLLANLSRGDLSMCEDFDANCPVALQHGHNPYWVQLMLQGMQIRSRMAC